MYGIIINKDTKAFIHEHTSQICEFQGGAVLVLNDQNEPRKVVTMQAWEKMVDPGGITYLYAAVTNHLKARFGITPEFERRIVGTGAVGPWMEGLGRNENVNGLFEVRHVDGLFVTYNDGSGMEYRRNH